MDKERVKRSLVRKYKSKDKIYYDHITADENDPGWMDAIKQARGRGISIKSFADTSDKFVLTPRHINYNFDYYWSRGYWSRGYWSSQSCWNEKVPQYIINQANSELIDLGFILCQYCNDIKVCCISGRDKGYLSTQILSLEEVYDDLNNGNLWSDDLVLFVYDSPKTILGKMK